MVDRLSLNWIITTSIQFGDCVSNLGEAKEKHPADARGVGSIVEEHIPKLLGADVDGTEFLVCSFVEFDVRSYETRNWVCSAVFYAVLAIEPCHEGRLRAYP